MGAATVVTLAGVAIAVAALAVYVIAIGLSLSRLSRKLGTLGNALRGIRDQTAPVGSVLGGMLQDATAIEGDLDELLAAVRSMLVGAPPKTGPASMEEAVAVARTAATRTAPAPPQAAPPASVEKVVARAGSSPMSEAVAKARERVSTG